MKDRFSLKNKYRTQHERGTKAVLEPSDSSKREAHPSLVKQHTNEQKTERRKRWGDGGSMAVCPQQLNTISASSQLICHLKAICLIFNRNTVIKSSLDSEPHEIRSRVFFPPRLLWKVRTLVACGYVCNPSLTHPHLCRKPGE